MAKLAYYGALIPGKQNWVETPEGFRIYKNTPICRTGFQEYLGKELKDHPDYDPAWDIADDQVVKLFRPKDVVTAAETIASFEGKSVLDGHPPADVKIVLTENENEYGRGHMQNVRVGPAMDDGETPLLADLFVKDQLLNDKIDGGTRDVSCGYVYGLKRGDDGTFVMTRIMGNHVAVVPKGRAGPEVSIQDAAVIVSEPIRKNPEIKQREKCMPKENFWSRLFKKVANDADPEDLTKLAKLMAEEAEPDEKEKDEKEKPAKDKAAKDAEENGEVDLHPRLAKACDQLDAIFEHLGVGKEKKEDEPKEDETTGDADVLEMTGAEEGKTELPKQIAADTAEFLMAVRPLVVAKKDKKLTGLFNKHLRAVKSAAANDAFNPYAGLANPSNPNESDLEEIDPTKLFNGVPYAEGVRRYNEYQANKAKKGNK